MNKIVEIRQKDLIKILSMQSRDKVKNMFRTERNNSRCNNPYCNKKGKLETAHKKNWDRPKIVENIISKMSINNSIFNLNLFWKNFEEFHKKKKMVHFLCNACHLEYDNGKISDDILK
ncbi:MAG: hypothetical protein WC947_05625 [Elusimicrobiota bacterium]